VKIIDNFLDDHDFKNIFDLVSGPYFSWYWSNVVDEEDLLTDDPRYNFQLGHMLFCNGESNSVRFDNFLPFLSKLPDMNTLIRMKINLNPKTDTIIRHGFHTDFDGEGKTAVFYFNTCNGYTEFEDSGDIVKSKKNRMVIFDMMKSHTGTTCTDQSRRIVLNINYK